MRSYLNETYGPPDARLRTYDDLVTFWGRLKPGQVAIVASSGHVAVLKHGYQDPYVSEYLGDAWKLPESDDCGVCE